MASKDQWHGARASELHREAAERFGWAWVAANELVTSAARKADIGEFTGRDAHMLSLVALGICERDAAASAGKEG